MQELLRITKVECEACGQPLAFQGCGEYMCPNCGHKQVDDFGKVRLFLEHYPGATLVQVSQETGVSVAKIREFISADRLEVVDRRFL